ncbi:MAG: MFS transporter [Hyphomicrobiaceae bacterium]
MPTHLPDTSGRPIAIRLACIYGAVFFIVGIQTAYLPAWLLTRGVTETGIGMVLSIPMLVRVFTTPLITLAADRFRQQRQTLVLLSWGVLASACALMFASSFAAILLVMIVYATFWTTVMPMTEALAMRGVQAYDLDYGRMRLWGSLTFIAASLAGGWVLGRYGADPIVPMMIAAALALVIAAHVLRATGFPAPMSGGSEKVIGLTQAIGLLRDNRLLLLFLTSGTAQATHAIYYAFGTIHWQATGLAAVSIGILWAIGVIAEIGLFMISARVVARIAPAQLMLIAAAAGLVRWPLTALDPPFAALCLIQVLHGLTFGAAHLGAIHLIGRLAGEDLASTAQGLHATFAMGIFMAAGMAAAGPLYRAFGGNAYLAMAILAGVAALAALALIASLRSHPQSAGSGG